MNRVLWKTNRKGFTLAEVMIAVAIIAILAGVSFIGVTRYMRSMAQLECDGFAKEIFVAAQNHLTMAEGQGFYGIEEGKGSFGSKESDNTYYYTVNAGKVSGGIQFDSSSLLGVMLPFGSIDDTIRMGGNYIIRYQINPARILDVFYCAVPDDRYGHSLGESPFDCVSLKKVSGDTNKGSRSNYNGAVIGWYGDTEIDGMPFEDLGDLKLELVNSDVLFANVSGSFSGKKLQLIIEGNTSKAVGYIELDPDPTKLRGDGITVILDDITTADHHFSQIGTYAIVEEGTKFIPGENIRVYAKGFDTTKISKIVKSTTKSTNSLFAEYVTVDATTGSDPAPAYTELSISSMRHLYNLNDLNSGMFLVNGAFSEKAVFNDSTMIRAKQINDLDWPGFLTNAKSVNPNAGESAAIKDGAFNATSLSYSQIDEGCWLPVSPSYQLHYNGDYHRISNLKVDYAGDAGLIGSMQGGSLSNLELVDFKVTATDTATDTGYAGALAGKLDIDGILHTTAVSNIIAYNTSEFDKANAGVNITAESGSAGGLIGYMKSRDSSSVFGEYGYVDGCGAALYVNGAENAGGLIGEIEGPLKVRNSYSGGHTLEGGYSDNITVSDAESKGLINVIGGRSTGGLIGNAGAAVISNSYSTCSAYSKGDTGIYAGGFVGEIGGGSITNCYSTGYVSKAIETAAAASTGDTTSGSTDTGTIKILSSIGAFAGHVAPGVTLTNNQYYMIINERADNTTGFKYLSPVGGSKETVGITALDDTATSYNTFSGIQSTWTDAAPYDSALKNYYHDVDHADQAKYNLKGISKLYNTLDPGAYVKTHYGDWPAPEIFVINTP